MDLEYWLTEYYNQTWSMSVQQQFSTAPAYDILKRLDAREIVPALIRELRLSDQDRRFGMAALVLLRDITEENPDKYAYTLTHGGFVGVTVQEAIEAWIKWWDSIGQYRYEEECEIPLD